MFKRIKYVGKANCHCGNKGLHVQAASFDLEASEALAPTLFKGIEPSHNWKAVHTNNAKVNTDSTRGMIQEINKCGKH